MEEIEKHNRFWADRLEIGASSGIHFSKRGLWDRRDAGDLDTVGFLYASKNLCIVDVSEEYQQCMKEALSQQVDWNLERLVEAANLSEHLEVDCNDVDFFRLKGASLPSLKHELGQIKVSEERPLGLDAFLDSQPEESVITCGLDDEFDTYYTLYVGEEIIGCLGLFKGGSSYFHSLSILTSHSHLKQGIAKALLYQAVSDLESKGEVLCFRVNVDNSASIALCKSLGFEQFNRIQTLSKIST